MESLRVRFNDLTPQERSIICNGCGPKGGIVPVPDFIFTACCDHHDFNYWLGCREIQRKKADLQFYREMVRDACRARDNKTRAKFNRIALVYYCAVRLFGRFCFHYADQQRTRVDLQKQVFAADDINSL
jgi:hypothetical protein